MGFKVDIGLFATAFLFISTALQSEDAYVFYYDS
jgi:hypothetical protein